MTPADVAQEICRQTGYQFVALEGTGAFKHTFHVRAGGQSLALKVYLKGLTKRSTREIAAMRLCDHENIAKFVSLESVTVGADEYIYLLEEYLSGGSLATRIGSVTPEEVASLALKMSQALEHIGAHKLVHRDIKPENIMFRDGSLSLPVIVDFGLVRDLNAASLTATYAMQGPGTPMYSAPEQLNNEKGMITSRTDQFGLGATLAHLLFQMHPYARPGDSLADAVQRAANWEGPSREFVDACSLRGLAPLVRMVSSFPVDRYRNATELTAAWLPRV